MSTVAMGESTKTNYEVGANVSHIKGEWEGTLERDQRRGVTRSWRVEIMSLGEKNLRSAKIEEQ